jgi:uncharacterized protein
MDSSQLDQFRTSSYVIFVDLPDTAEETLLVHGYTGAYDKVSKSVARFLRSREARPSNPLYGNWASEKPNGDCPMVQPSEATLNVLRRRGYLTEMSCEEEEQAFKRIAFALHNLNSRKVSYVFMPTYDCNLRCSYCFQDHMRTDEKFQHLLRTMTLEMVDRIFLGASQIEAAHGLDSSAPIARSIGFFGGEPLLAANQPIVSYIIDKSLSIGPASFWAVSNATELEAYEALLSPTRISSIQITLDGPPAEHDKRRIYADGAGSFEKISRNITLALDRGVNISIRMNLDRRNIQQVPEFTDLAYRLGWNKYSNFSVYAAPIRAANENVPQAEVMDSWELDKAVAGMQERHSTMSLVGQPDDGLKQQVRRIFGDSRNGIPTLKESFCSAHSGMYIFDAFGDIYACWERTGDSSVRIGHINEDGSLAMNTSVLQLWRSRTVASNPVCSKCKYALHCGGGCAVLAERKTGLLHMNYCDSFGARFRSNVADAFADHVAGRSLPERHDRVCDQ